jgi:hypothetical protein
MPVRGAAQIIGQSRIIHAPGHDHAADAQGHEGKRALACPRFVEVRLEKTDQLLQDLAVGRFHRTAAARYVRRERDQRAATLPVVEVTAREIRVDDPLGARLARRR